MREPVVHHRSSCRVRLALVILRRHNRRLGRVGIGIGHLVGLLLPAFALGEILLGVIVIGHFNIAVLILVFLIVLVILLPLVVFVVRGLDKRLASQTNQ
jgi:hypothetical protein